MRTVSEDKIGKVVPGWELPPSGYATLCIFKWKLYFAGAGHCGLSVKQNGINPTRRIYVTGRGSGVLFRSEMYRGIIDENFDAEDDRNSEPTSGQAQVFIPLRGNSDGDEVGLDARRILQFWDSQRHLMKRDPMYKAISMSKNCNAYCRRALEAGGAGLFKKKPGRCGFQGAKEVAYWAAEVALRIKTINENLVIFKNLPADLLDPINQSVKSEGILTAARWKEISRVGMFARRKEQVAMIDRCLAEYDKVRNSPHHNDEKLMLLNTILGAGLEHLVTKPKSDRRNAVKVITAQAYAAIRKLTAEHQPRVEPEAGDFFEGRPAVFGRARSRGRSFAD